MPLVEWVCCCATAILAKAALKAAPHNCWLNSRRFISMPPLHLACSRFRPRIRFVEVTRRSDCYIASMPAGGLRRWCSVRPIAYRNVNCGIAAYFFFVRVQRDVIPQVGSQGCRVDFGDKKHHVGKPGSFDAGIQIPLL